MTGGFQCDRRASLDRWVGVLDVEYLLKARHQVRRLCMYLVSVEAFFRMPLELISNIVSVQAKQRYVFLNITTLCSSVVMTSLKANLIHCRR